MRHTRNRQCRACAGEHGRRARHPAGRGDARPHGGIRRGAVMSEWWTYRLSDFLMFSPRTYHRLFELHNAEALAAADRHDRGGACGALGSQPGGGAAVAASSRRCWLRRGLSWPGPITSSATRPSTPAAPYYAVGFASRPYCWPGALSARRSSFRSAACADQVDRLGPFRRRRGVLSAACPAAGPRLDTGRDLRRRARSDGGCDHRRASAGQRPHRLAARAAAPLVRDHRAHAVDDGSA